MPEEIQRTVAGVAGMAGEGKSTLLRSLLSEETRLVIIDTLGEHSKWCPRFPSDDIAEQVKFLASPPDEFRYSFLISPEWLDPDTNRNLHFNQLMKGIMWGGNMTAVIEECDKWCGSNWCEPGLEGLIDYGRHWKIDMIWATRNLPQVSRKLTSQTTHFFLFAQDEPLYLEKMGERFGDEIITTVAHLEQHHYIKLEKMRTTKGREWIVTENGITKQGA